MRSRFVGLVALGLAVLLGACSEEQPEPQPSPTEPTRPFTLATTARVQHTDPVAATSTADQEFVTNVFQRLMRVPPGEQVLKPDLATDCGFFEAERIYTCTIDPEVTFANGDPLTADDIAFSIERSQRLRPADTPGALWGSLDRVEVVNPTTVRFVLNRPDSQFGFVLATPAAAIVQASAYPADEVLDDPLAASGSGPFIVTGAESDRMVFAPNEEYRGSAGGQVDEVVRQVYPDSASIEEAMVSGEVDAAWRGLNAQAHTRMARQIDSNGEVTNSGFGRFTVPGGRVQRLLWQESSTIGDDPAARLLVRDALQDDRTLDSIVPPQIHGHRSSFAEGGQATPVVPWEGARPLRLAADRTAPDASDQLATLSTRLEDTGGFTVQLVDPAEPADLVLTDDSAANASGVAWTREYLDRPTRTTAVPLMMLRSEYGRAADAATRDHLLGVIQATAVVDATVVPVWQSDEPLYLGQGYTYDIGSAEPGWTLEFWGFRSIG